jgi:hypothetical protein
MRLSDGSKLTVANALFAACLDTTEFRRGIDEATNRTHEMLRNLQGSLGSIKIKLKL